MTTQTLSSVGREKLLAIKVMNKDHISKKDIFNQRQLWREIKVQRSMKLCGNTVQLYKVYENDNFINLVMDHHDGGTLGELI